MTTTVTIVLIVIAFFIGALCGRSKLFKKKGALRIFGTIMIPRREEEKLKGCGSDLTIVVGEPGGGGKIEYVFVFCGEVPLSKYGGLSSGVEDNILWGASFRSNHGSFDSIVIPGEFTEGVVTGAIKQTGESKPEPCIINIVLF